MKIKRKTTLLMFLLTIFVYSYAEMMAECPPNSGTTEPCEPYKKFPYRVCVYNEDLGVMEQKIICTAMPDTLYNVGEVNKVDLPICVEHYVELTEVILGAFYW